MKKVLTIIGKVLLSIFVTPFAFVGGFLFGLCLAICYMFILPITVILDIFEL